ncbi:MAG: FKBP-type peptidyl-prolyl cis-trans isomerase [archaeon]
MPKTSALVVKKGSKIKLDYEGKLDNGEIFDSSKHGDHSHPLEFEAGSGQVIKGFDKAVIGMKKNQEKEFKLKPEEACGNYNSDLIKPIPRDKLASRARTKSRYDANDDASKRHANAR